MLSRTHGVVLASIQAVSAVGMDADVVTLLLLPEVVMVVDCRESVQQQAFALSEIDCNKFIDLKSTFLQIILTGVSQQQIPPVSERNKRAV